MKSLPLLHELLENDQKIAFGGPSCVGKTTASRWAERIHGYHIFSLATPIKDMVSAFLTGFEDRRTAYQTVGEAFRVLDPEVWLKWLHGETVGLEKVVVDDVRLPLEERFLNDHGFLVIRILAPEDALEARARKRDGKPMSLPQRYHPTESLARAIRGDTEITNEGTIPEFWEALETLHVHAYAAVGASLVPEKVERDCRYRVDRYPAHSEIDLQCSECGAEKTVYEEVKGA